MNDTASNRQSEAESKFTEEDISQWTEDDEELSDDTRQQSTSEETIEEKYARSQLRVVRETRDFTLDYLRHALKRDSFVINVSPEYQRRQRWSRKKRSQLIESFLMNIPIPPIFLFEREYNEYEVVDGRQRLDSVREFLSNSFALTGLEYWGELNRKRYEELSLVIQRGLLRRSIPAVVLLAETRDPDEDDFDVRRILFDRLNTGGEKLNPQELRNALYPGAFNQLLIDLARSPEFTQAWGIPAYVKNENEHIPSDLAQNLLYKTMADCELVLRFFAIKEAIEEDRRGSLRRLLDNCMKRHYQDSPEALEYLRQEFTVCFRQLFATFDGQPFRIPNIPRPSRPLYDAMMVALSQLEISDLSSDKKSIQNRLDQALNNDSEYELIVGRKGNSFEKIKQRIQLAGSILTGEGYDDQLT